MVNILKRMRRLKELLDIRLGPGAMIMKPEVTRIHMQFAKKINGGHMGPRKFWRTMLPRLKYHNPAVHMTVDRVEDQEAPAIMSVYLSQARSSQGPSRDQSAPEKEEKIDMKMKTDTHILEQLTQITDGQQIEATAQEREELEMLAEQRSRSQRDAEIQAEVLAKRKREQEVLEQARRSSLVQ